MDMYCLVYRNLSYHNSYNAHLFYAYLADCSQKDCVRRVPEKVEVILIRFEEEKEASREAVEAPLLVSLAS